MGKRYIALSSKADGVSYGIEVERAALDLVGLSVKSELELLRTAAEQFGARRAMVVSVTSGGELRIEKQWSDPDVGTGPPASKVKTFLSQHLVDTKRVFIIPGVGWGKGKYLGAKNVLIHRFGAEPGGENWNRALVLAGRHDPPLRGSSPPQFLTYDYALTDAFVERYVALEQARVRLGARPPLAEQATAFDKLTRHFGGDVRLTLSCGSIVLSNVPAKGASPSIACRIAAETCLCHVAIGLPERVYLEMASDMHRERGRVFEFDILVCGRAVFGRRVTVRQYAAEPSYEVTIPSGRAASSRRARARLYATEPSCEVTIPTGWWWELDPDGEPLPPEDAFLKALELSGQRPTSNVKHDHISTALWPDRPGLIVHEFRVTEGTGSRATWFLDAQTGEILRRRRAIRRTPPAAGQ